MAEDKTKHHVNESSADELEKVTGGATLVIDNSTITLNLSNGSKYTGCINGNIKNASGTTVSTEVGTVNVALDGTSTCTLTGDIYVTSFTGDASNIISNGYILYVNGTPLSGTN